MQWCNDAPQEASGAPRNYGIEPSRRWRLLRTAQQPARTRLPRSTHCPKLLHLRYVSWFKRIHNPLYQCITPFAPQVTKRAKDQITNTNYMLSIILCVGGCADLRRHTQLFDLLPQLTASRSNVYSASEERRFSFTSRFCKER